MDKTRIFNNVLPIGYADQLENDMTSTQVPWYFIKDVTNRDYGCNSGFVHIAYDLGKENEGYEEYLLIMEVKNGSLAATYDEKGKLTRVVEDFRNVKLPSQVIYSVYRTYPQWSIVNDRFLYTQEEGDVIKKQYNLKIKKGKETRKLVVRPNGEILKIK